MAGVYLLNFWYISVLTIGLIELFFFSYFFFYTLNSLKIFKNNNYLLLSDNSNTLLLKYIYIMHIICCLSIKCINTQFITSYNFFNIYFIIFCLYYFFIINNIGANTFYFPIVVLSLYCLAYYYTITVEYITLLLIIETITTLYYFFFLKYSKDKTVTLIKYKNLISQYLWLSFFTLVFFVINTILWVYLYGTLNYTQLSYFLQNKFFCIFILIAFFWKLGLPIFHFYKLELYQFLNFLNLIIFSLTSLIVNSILFIYLLYIINLNFTITYTPILIILMFSLILMFQGVDKLSVFYFFAISSINTWIFFLIISFS